MTIDAIGRAALLRRRALWPHGSTALPHEFIPNVIGNWHKVGKTLRAIDAGMRKH